MRQDVMTQKRLDPAFIRQKFSRFPSGIAALAAVVDGEKHGLVASSFTVGVSMDPTLVMFAVQKSSSTWPLLAGAERIGISVLSAEQDVIARQLAGKDKAARFVNLPTEQTPEGALFISSAALWMDCSVYGTCEAGDHDVVLFEVHQMRGEDDVEPLVFHGSGFRQLAPQM